MPTEFLLASVGAGKTEAAQARLRAFKQAHPFEKTWCLLATERQIRAFRQRLVQHPDSPRVFFNIEFFTFYTLYRHILELAGKPQRVLDEAARLRLLRLIVTQMERGGDLELYHSIAHTQGFIHILASFIYELKQNLIDHTRFGSLARTAKDRDLALIYTRYQELLMHYDLVDREGEGWRALDELDNNRHLASDLSLLIVDGYDPFNRLQADLIALLAGRAGERLVTLTTVPGRERTIGQRFQRALDRLMAAHNEENVFYSVRTLPIDSASRPAPLRHLVEQIFRSDAPKMPAGEQIVLLEAPDAAAETAAALRRVKKLLLDGARPDDILIAVRDLARYAPYLAAHARTYDLPLALDGSEQLDKNPAIYALTALLELHKGDFRRRDLLDLLRSAYVRVPGLQPEDIDWLERASQTHLVVRGRAEWLGLLQPTETTRLRSDEDETVVPDALDESERVRLLAVLTDFFDAVTPPSDRSAEDYVAWLEDLIGDDPLDNVDDEEAPVRTPKYSLDMIACARQSAADGVQDRIVLRDLAALSEFKRLLHGLLSAHRLFRALDMTAALGWDAFWGDLRGAIKMASAAAVGGRDGRVLATTVDQARGLPHPHVIVLGLSEGVFPMRTPEDPIYLDSERRTLQQRGLELATQQERSDDDGLFYEMISLATRSLTLTRTTFENGAPLPPSHLWRAVCALFDPLSIHTQRIGAVVPAADSAATAELALALADGLSWGDASAAAAHAWFADAHAQAWRQLHHTRAVELRRMSHAPHDRYSGRLQDAELIAQAAAAFEDRVWSASQLNDYGMCAFRFFAKRLLGLETLDEPSEGMDALQLGSLYHEILEHTYRELAQRGLPIHPDHCEEALSILEREAERLLNDAPARLGFRASALWDEERTLVLRGLRTLVIDDFDPDSSINRTIAQLASGERRPDRQELPFGERGFFSLDVGGESLRLRGVIDRLDRVGDRAVVIDYKSGSGEIPVTEIARGRNFQMMIYVLAAQSALAQRGERVEIAGGLFWHIGARKASGVLLPGDDAIPSGLAHLQRYLARGRAGDFASSANKIEQGKCSRYCEYSQMCRLSIVHKRKADA